MAVNLTTRTDNEGLVERLRPLLAGIVRGEWQVEAVHGGQSGSRVLRVLPQQGSPLIVKLLRAEDVPVYLRSDYPGIAASEFHFYTELMPRLGLPGPKVSVAGKLPDGTFFLVLEDLAPTHAIFPDGHIWTDPELQPVVRAYGLLHGRSLRFLQQGPTPAWLQADPRQTYNPDRVLSCIRALAANPGTAEASLPVANAPRLEDLVRRVPQALAEEPAVVLYNDFYPPNVAIPLQGGPAKLFDWQLVGSGPMQVDIVNIGLLGRSEAFAAVDRSALLDLYLETLAGETGHRPNTDAFRTQCGYASLLGWGVFLPRMLKNLRQRNAERLQFTPSMERLFRQCMTDWAEALGL